MREEWYYYSENASKLFELYRAVPFEIAQCAWLHLLPTNPVFVLDIGAGSGRDATWFAEHGHKVIAVEPSPAFREIGRKYTPHSVQWIDDSLPALTEVNQLGLKFDIILVSAVWMHVLPGERKKAFREISSLLRLEGILVIILRETPFNDTRSFFPTPPEELHELGKESHLKLVLETQTAHTPGQPEIKWLTVVFRK